MAYLMTAYSRSNVGFGARLYVMHRLCHPNEDGCTKQQIFNVDETSFLLEEDAIEDFHSLRGEVNAWFQSFKG